MLKLTKERYQIYLIMIDLEKVDYISNKNNNKIKIPNNVLYIQIDDDFEPIW
ncbi:hypothetical protein [Spiroplasma endosymbiont of Polydrusus formosus]|uniref:hypothetical protein n=1 Tax=Spiroplasma endosymbiont of Polydrusus formosus TaxID=3139326 RepID=UPI0035B52FE3